MLSPSGAATQQVSGHWFRGGGRAGSQLEESGRRQQDVWCGVERGMEARGCGNTGAATCG